MSYILEHDVSVSTQQQLEEDFDTNLDSHAPLIREAVKAFVVGPSKTSTSPLSKQKSPLYSPPRTSSASSTTESEQTKAQAPKRVLHRTASKESSSTVILDSSQSELNDSQKEGSSAVLDLTTTEDDVIKGTVQKQIKKEPKHHGRSVQFQEDSDEEPYTQRATTGSKKNKTAKQPSASHSAATKSRKRKQPVEDDQEHDDGTDERNHSVPESSANAENGTDKKRATEAVGASSKKLASSLPLTVAPGVARRQRTTVLVQVDCDEDLLNISGDVGSIGRMNTTDNGIILDLQGHRYAGTIAPSLSHMVVGISRWSIDEASCLSVATRFEISGFCLLAAPKEAKVESVTNDFVQLDHLQNVIEEMKGTMTGTSFTMFSCFCRKTRKINVMHFTEGSEDIKELFRVEDVDAMGDINDDDDDRPISRVSSTNKEETDGEQDASARGTKSKKRKQKASSRPTQMIGKARKASTNRSKKSSKKS